MSDDWSKLLNDENLKNSYAVGIRNRFEQLQNLNPDNFSTNDIYENIRAHAEAAEKYVPKKSNQRDSPWENDVVCKKRNELNEAFKRKKEKNDLTNSLLETPWVNHHYNKLR